MSSLAETYTKAFDFARRAHAAVGQLRAYTGEPYHHHCVAVAERVRGVVGDTDPAMIEAALLHDVLEDTGVDYAALEREFGADVADLVLWLTERYTADSGAGNRRTRKALEARRLRGAPDRAKTIKLADLLDNAGSIVARDKAFARVYLREKAALLVALDGGNEALMREASTLVADCFLKLGLVRRAD